MNEEKKLICKYCKKEIGKGVINPKIINQLQGLISHPKCYNENNDEVG